MKVPELPMEKPEILQKLNPFAVLNPVLFLLYRWKL